MKKNNKPLIIIIFVFILELVIIGALGVTFLKSINNIEQKIQGQEIKDVHQIQVECRDVKEVVKKELVLSMVACAIMTLIMVIYL